MKLAIALLILGSVLIGSSAMFGPYKDKDAFETRYMQLKVGDSSGYWALRDEMLTPKFKLQDYGITLLVLALVSWLCLRAKPIAAVRSPLSFAAIAVAAPCLMSVGYVFDYLQAFDRGEFPYWGDSMAIPLMSGSVGLLFKASLLWSFLHLTLLIGTRRSAMSLRVVPSWRSNPWLLFLSVGTAGLAAFSLVLGQYWYAVPSLLWLYFYLSLAAVRRARNRVPGAALPSS
jgi:hypothetical protein